MVISNQHGADNDKRASTSPTLGYKSLFTVSPLVAFGIFAFGVVAFGVSGFSAVAFCDLAVAFGDLAAAFGNLAAACAPAFAKNIYLVFKLACWQN